MAQLSLFLLGSPRIELDGKPVEVDTRKALALMAYLALDGGAHQREALAGLLWPDYEPANARGALRRTLSTLNKALQDLGSSEHLEITRDSVRLLPDADTWVDIKQMREYVNACGRHGHSASQVCPACLPELKAAANLYRGGFMAGFSLRDSPPFEEWQFFQDEGLQREIAGVLERLAVGLHCQGTPASEHESAPEYARRYLALDPLNEEAHRLLMLLYAHSGQHSAALRQYRECVRILDEELGVPPVEETTHLYQAILSRGALPELTSRWTYVAEPAVKPAQVSQPIRAAEPPTAPSRTANPFPLVGRDAELARLREIYIHIQQGANDGGFAALEGEAGIGKSRLAAELLAQAQSQGAAVIQARCYQGETSLAYGPFVDGLTAALNHPQAAGRLASVAPGWLAEAARLLPEISLLVPGLPAPLPLDGPGAQARFFEGLRQVVGALLAGEQPGILFLDDLHWADAASLDLLTYLARRTRGMRCLILGAWRSEAGEVTQKLQRLTAELARYTQQPGTAHLKLRRLERADVLELVQNRLAGGASLGERLYQESEGLPFVAVAYLDSLERQGMLAEADATGAGWELPGSVRDLLLSQTAGLDETSRQLLSAAAVIGRSFDASTLREASGRSELETVSGLEALLEKGLVQERGMADGELLYDFTHEKLRALMYEETSLARRRLLHRRVAECLLRPSPARRESPLNAAAAPALAAYHYHQAGMDELAAEFDRLAGEQARALFANVEALAHFESALAAGHPDRAGLHQAIGDLHTLRGDYPAAIASYETAAALCAPGCLAELEHKLGSVHHRRGDWALADQHYQNSLEALEDDPDPAALAHLFADWSLTARARGHEDQAQERAQQALDLAHRLNSPRGTRALAQAHNALGILARSRGNIKDAITHLEESLKAAEALQDHSAQIAALNNLALVYGEDGQVEAAITLAERALKLCVQQGDRHREAALHSNLADLLHQAGREADSREQMKQAVVIFAEIGEPGEMEPEIWKLTEW